MWFLTLAEEYKLQVLANKVLRKTTGYNWNWKYTILHN